MTQTDRYMVGVLIGCAAFDGLWATLIGGTVYGLLFMLSGWCSRQKRGQGEG